LLAWKDLKDFLDGGTEGVIYFSLGSNVRSETMSEEKKQVFLSAFAELPQRVLRKWEANYTSDPPSNMKLAKWLPHQDILGELTAVMGSIQVTSSISHVL
jgi:glucuronosyltransferase